MTLTTDKPTRIQRGNQQLIRHTQVNSSRNVLAPYVGQTFYLSGTVSRHSRRNGRLFVCLADVDLCSYEDSRKEQAERIYIPIDHCWQEVAKGKTVPPVGDEVTNFCTVSLSVFLAWKRIQTWTFRILIGSHP